MEKITKIEIELHELDNDYIKINLTPESETKLINRNYTDSIIISHMFAQLSYSIMTKNTMNEIDEMCDRIAKQTTVCDLFGTLADEDDDTIQEITQSAIKSGIELVKHNIVKDAAETWQECLLCGIASLLSPTRDASNKHYKYLMMLPERPTKLNRDYVEYFKNIIQNTRNCYSSNLTSEEIEGYIVNILSLIVEQHIEEYTKVNKKIPDKDFFNTIQQHLIKITTEALSVIIAQIKEAYKESEIYTKLNSYTMLSEEEEAELTAGIDFRDILKSYKDNINKFKNNKEDDEEDNDEKRN